MNTATRRHSYWLLLFLALLAFALAAGGRPFAPVSAAEEETVITVYSGSDPDARDDLTCENAAPCTLRRAIVQANKTSRGARPVTIKFDIPPDEEEGYDEELGAWRIELQDGAGTAVLPTLVGGGISIDGSTQAGDRELGPLIILVGPGDGRKDGLILGRDNSGNDDENKVLGLAFQNFRNHVVVNASENLVAECWFGLDDEGLGPYLREDDLALGSGEIGVAVAPETSGNYVEGSNFLGFNKVAVALHGDESSALENMIGTDAEGEVPEEVLMSVREVTGGNACAKGDWLGGGGISVEGVENEIADNTLAGLRQETIFGVQPDAISVTGDLHYITDNFIGLDFNGEAVGVCGRGILLADGPEEVWVADNHIANPVLSALSLNGQTYRSNTLSSNLIQRQTAWQEEETAVQLGYSLPQSLADFVPAQITEIKGSVVTGKSGVGSPCPNCQIEIFLDDKDNIAETLDSLAIVTADAKGEWQATLHHGPTLSQGLRTMSTTAAKNTIPGLGPGTTTGLSALYLPELEYSFLPVVLGK